MEAYSKGDEIPSDSLPMVADSGMYWFWSVGRIFYSAGTVPYSSTLLHIKLHENPKKCLTKRIKDYTVTVLNCMRIRNT